MGTKRRRFTQDFKARAELPASCNDQGVSDRCRRSRHPI